MSVAEIRIEGAKKLERKLARLPKKVGRKVVTSALRKGAKIIREQTKSLAPRKSGVLKKSIITRLAKKKRHFPDVKAFVQLFNTRKFPELIGFSQGSAFNIITRKQVTGTRGFYPAAVEYGRAAKGRAGGPKITKPKSFVKAGFDQGKRRAEAKIIKEIRMGIEKAWRER